MFVLYYVLVLINAVVGQSIEHVHCSSINLPWKVIDAMTEHFRVRCESLGACWDLGLGYPFIILHLHEMQ